MKSYKKSDYYYTALFCEENIWHLARALRDEGFKEDNINILFLTNKNKQIAIFKQLSAEPEQAVIWDYHVVLIVNIKQSHYIFDFDTRLDFITSYEHYIKESFPASIHPLYQSHCRIIPAHIYLQHFYSDRSHMKDIISAAQFPGYPAILPTADNNINLYDLFDSEKKIDNTSIIYNFKQFLI